MFEIFENNIKLAKNLDSFILGSLFDLALEGNLNFHNLKESYSNFKYKDYLLSPKEYLARIYYLYLMWFLELEVSNDIQKIKEICKNESIDHKFIFLDNKYTQVNTNEYLKYIVFWRITKTWVEYLLSLRKEILNSIWLKWVFFSFKQKLEFLFKYKIAFWFASTAICVIAIFVFDIKISDSLSKMPLVSSVINTDILKAFEDVNENDDYYKELSKQVWINKKDWKYKLSDDVNSVDIKVQSVSANEKRFKLTFLDWSEQLITVNKNSDWRFMTNIPQILKDKVNKLKTRFR